jgi:hypothetical protein
MVCLWANVIFLPIDMGDTILSTFLYDKFLLNINYHGPDVQKIRAWHLERIKVSEISDLSKSS